MSKNYVKADSTLPWRVDYFYIDRKPWLADRIFAKHQLVVHFAGDYHNDKNPYAVVECWVWPWQTSRFEACMDELARDSLLMGRGDYLDACKTMRRTFDQDAR